MVNVNSLELVILPGKNPPSWLVNKYEAAYRCWKRTWEEAALDLEEMPTELYSTEFTRQDEVLALFCNGECSSLGFWNELDFEVSSAKDDFYFQRWTSKAFEGLQRDGKKIGVYSYLTVAESFRKNRFDISFKDLQIGIFVKKFLSSKMNGMTGTTRNNRGVNDVCERGGAVLLETGIEQYGVEVNLMAWYKDTARPWSGVNHIVEKVWENKKHYNEFIEDEYEIINEEFQIWKAI